mgnify:CR=1 FL=1
MVSNSALPDGTDPSLHSTIPLLANWRSRFVVAHMVCSRSGRSGGATNGPKVSVGTTGSAAAYGAAFDVGTLTAPSAKTVASTYHPSEAGYSTYMVNQVLPADTLVQLSIVAAAGSGNAGVGDAFMLIAWDD